MISFARPSRRLFGALAASLMFAGTVHAAEHGTAAEAEAMVQRAVVFLKANGPEKSYEEFTNGKSFKDRDLYVLVYDLNGKVLAHGLNAKMVGKDLIDAKDPQGKPIVKMFVDLAKTKGKGWTDSYSFMNPMTKTMQSKTLYLERAGDVLVGTGIYKD
jgi:hypothetical protein